MRIAATSDLHAPLGAWNSRIDATLLDAEPDVLVIAGDLFNWMPNPRHGLLERLRFYSEIDVPVLAVLGNHDLRLQGGGECALQRLTGLFPDNGVHCLDNAPYVHDGVGFVGCHGWYDSSLVADKGYTLTELNRCAYDLGERRHARWNAPDSVLAAKCLDKMRDDFARIECDDCVAVTHYIPLVSGLSHLGDYELQLHDAVMGSASYGAWYEKEPGITLALWGHRHWPFGRQYDSFLGCNVAYHQRFPLTVLDKTSSGWKRTLWPCPDNKC
ncbi:hypothetical protein COY28_02970 [Candidatus Woesearchaeota archaeon CG_4_10_14_0_2_um_filter_57_5]|nr:MAG: hypothetical protein AUJ68_06700 [Candidatus Woesearchaeota archaeon CG1_02_57_44]PIN70055.1 MAG: hypothetical protein COV94_02150 [Candidatus Woesearchaeota archaeon CG11_big_fil_rev_8_21_14_0_20_57_5]PIZ54054.1 MAG: hypothetical protein COY28_02970 [Candidatus Woesearchaeota archaeon CG_4_10_14_0_2_um_filter_57_5]